MSATRQSYFLKSIQKALDSENEELSDSDNEDEQTMVKVVDARDIPTEDANLSLVLSPVKYHAYLLNNMNIRVDETLSEYFRVLEEDDDNSDSESDIDKDDDKPSILSDEENPQYDEMWKKGSESDDKDMDSNDESSSKCKFNPSFLDGSADDKVPESIENIDNKDIKEKVLQSERSDYYHKKRKMKKFIDPFLNLPERSKLRQ